MMRKTLALSMALVANTAGAVTLTDFNSTVKITETADQKGVYEWTVDGTNHANQQWFWYRIGSSGPESSIDTLNHTGTTATTNSATVSYADSGGSFTLSITYSLTGGSAGSGQSLLAEEIRITNESSSALDFHFFQYSDFDVFGTNFDDTVEQLNANTVRQTDANTSLTETVGTPAPDRVEMALWASTLNSLNDGAATTLNNNLGPVGPGDATWAWQWDESIGVDGSLLISKNLRIEAVPVPAAVWLFGSGLLALVGFARRRR
jgi:hypothetical protein